MFPILYILNMKLMVRNIEGRIVLKEIFQMKMWEMLLQSGMIRTMLHGS